MEDGLGPRGLICDSEWRLKVKVWPSRGQLLGKRHPAKLLTVSRALSELETWRDSRTQPHFPSSWIQKFGKAFPRQNEMFPQWWGPEQTATRGREPETKQAKDKSWTDAESEPSFFAHTVCSSAGCSLRVRIQSRSCQVADGGRESSNHFSIQKL